MLMSNSFGKMAAIILRYTSGFVVRSQVLAAIWREFGKAGISIPFPQRDVHMIAPKGVDDVAAAKERVANEAPRLPDRRGEPGDFAGEAIDKMTSGD